MVFVRALPGTDLVVLLAGATGPGAAPAVRLADGRDWQKSSLLERRIYLTGVANTLALGSAWESQRHAGQDKTFVRLAARALQDTTFEHATAVIEGWYEANPSQMSRPVLAVLWPEIAGPKPARDQ